MVAIVVALVFATVVAAQVDDGTTSESVSEFVFPTAPSGIRFDHSKHAAVACTSCHGAAQTSQRASDDLRPPMRACAGCHEVTKPQLEDCSGCHVGYSPSVDRDIDHERDWMSVRPAPMPTLRPRPRVRFDHAAHAGRMGGERSCATCHGAGDVSLPPMESCNQCHNDTTAPSSCQTCHPTSPTTGKLEVEAGGRRLMPDNHGVDFAKRHAVVARASSDECMACHVEQDCASCHNASVAEPFAVHPPNYMTIHAVDARSGTGDCTDCHSTQTFCTSCHVRADVVTESPHRPPPRRRFHPPGWLEESMPANHGVMARRDINDCASCHTENDCITCHVGVNPHPTEFRLDCGRMLAANPAPCARCHQDPAALRALCL